MPDNYISEINMSDNKLPDNNIQGTSYNLIKYANNGDFKALELQLAGETAAHIVDSLANVCIGITQNVLDAVVDIYSRSLFAAYQLETKKLNNKAELHRRFNDQVDALIQKFEFKNDDEVQRFNNLCEQLLKNLDEQLESYRKSHSLLGRIQKLLPW